LKGDTTIIQSYISRCRTKTGPGQYPSVVIAVNDLKASMKKIDDAGGKILGEPMEIPGVGRA
jgi:hypothetical protein